MNLQSQTSRVALAAVAGSLALLVSACGGGGSSPTPTPTPPPANSAPQFTSASSATVVENSTGSVITLAASDANGDPITFTITGGADAARFTLSGSQLSFAASPNFDAYADSNRDNVYELTVQASDGRGGNASQNVAIAVTNDREGITVTRILTGLSDPVGMASTGQTAQELIVGMGNGTYVQFEGSRSGDAPLPTVRNFFPTGPIAPAVRMLDISWGPQRSGFPGLIGMFANGVSVGLSRPVTNGISESANLAIGDGRNVSGQIFFDGNREGYAALGDPQGTLAQLSTPPNENGFGKLFRIVSGSSASSRSFDGEEIAKGIQAPGGMALIGGSFAFADRGSTVANELNLFPINARPLNLGWPFLEGTQTLRTGAPSPLIGPSLVYPVGNGRFEGTGIVMGAAYSGPIAGIANHLVFADRNGSILSIPISVLTDGFLHLQADIELRVEDFRPNQGTLDSIIEIASDAAGTLYILDADGEVFRVDRA